MATDVIKSAAQIKYEPSAKLPTSTVLKNFSDGDISLLTRRLAEPIDFVFDPVFESADAPNYLTTMSASGALSLESAANDDSGVDLLAGPTPENAESCLFLRLNCARYGLTRVLQAHEGRRLSAEAAAQVLRLERIAVQTRDEIVRRNVPLVLAMSKRTRITGVDLSDLISEGNLALLRAVDKFDCSRGFKFSTYACRAILKSFSRVATRTSRYRGAIATEFDPVLEKSDFLDRRRDGIEKACLEELKMILGHNMAKLSSVEEAVIRARFAIEMQPPATVDEQNKGKTLEQVGEMIGVTKERVRQIQNKALNKLKTVLEAQALSNQ